MKVNLYQPQTLYRKTKKQQNQNLKENANLFQTNWFLVKKKLKKEDFLI